MNVLPSELTSAAVTRGVVISVRNEDVMVALDEDPAQPIRCGVLEPSEGARLRVAAGDAVLLWRPAPDARDGVILGRLGRGRAPLSHDAMTGDPDVQVPEELLLEAKHSLTLRVGDGSITIREDGKILIKGKDLVSHATRLNRIKGGAVQIN